MSKTKKELRGGFYREIVDENGNCLGCGYFWQECQCGRCNQVAKKLNAKIKEIKKD